MTEPAGRSNSTSSVPGWLFAASIAPRREQPARPLAHASSTTTSLVVLTTKIPFCGATGPSYEVLGKNE
jgi:hypothetical protein